MKNLTFFLLLSGVLLVFSNCKKDTEDDNPTYFLTAKVNGDDFSGGIVTGVQVGPFISVTGLEGLGLGNAMTLSIEETLTPGTYDFDINNTDEVAAGYGNQLPGGILVDAESGSMTLTEIDTTAKIVSGTFEFSGVDANSSDTYNITAVEFNVNYN